MNTPAICSLVHTRAVPTNKDLKRGSAPSQTRKHLDLHVLITGVLTLDVAAGQLQIDAGVADPTANRS